MVRSGTGPTEATYLRGSKDVLDGHGNLRANAVTLDETNGVVSLSECVSLARLASWGSKRVVVLSDFGEAIARERKKPSNLSPVTYIGVLLS